MEVLENHERIEQAGHQHHGPTSPNKRIALLISVLAALLAITETAGKGKQTEAINNNVHASDLWSFYQAKTVRSTVAKTSSDLAKLFIGPDLPADRQAAIQKQLDSWKADINRYDSDPETGEGRKELLARAKATEEIRDTAAGAYHLYESAAAALQLAIVLASAAVITDLGIMAILALGLGGVGVVLDLLAWWTPMILHGTGS
ncbi:MAG: DUF4337 domain-containing protein [Azospirillaceae bacterium]|nr:DUF4337 domain-containing protein [Azospirillaceae bacterium]